MTFNYPRWACLSRKRPGKPSHNPFKYLIEFGIWDPWRLPRNLCQSARRDGVEVVANHPILAAIDGYRQLPCPRAVALRFSRKRHDQARPRQGIFVGKHHDRPGFPHFWQLRVSPKIAPIKLPMFRGGDNSRLDAGRLLVVAVSLRSSQICPYPYPAHGRRYVALRTVLAEILLTQSISTVACYHTNMVAR